LRGDEGSRRPGQYEELTLTGGRIEPGIGDMPKVEVHIVPSQEPPTGVGELGVQSAQLSPTR
jgi:hypothetical protein